MASTHEKAQARARNVRRDNLIIEMFEGGAKYRLIQAALERSEFGRISMSRISEIINRVYKEEGERRRELAERIFDHKLAQLDATIRTNWSVINAKCKRCNGLGTLGQDPDKAPGTLMVCDKCDGTLFLYHPRDRATASKEVRMAIDQQCKMLGLYAPEKFAFTDTEGNDIDFWAQETRNLDSDDLERELDLYLSGVHAGREEQKHSTQREEQNVKAAPGKTDEE